MDRKRLEAFQEVAKKSHQVLVLILGCFCLLVSRMWYLTTYAHEKRKEEAYRAQFRYEMVSAPRGTICDRFSLPLATNRAHYQVSIVWADIVEKVPRKIADTRPEALSLPASKRWRFVRSEYVKALSKMLAASLPSLQERRVEDSIYSYAVYANTIPFVLASGITQEQYSQLAAKAFSWPGLRLEIVTKRHYPHGKALSHVLGYTAPIRREEYEAALDIKTKIIREMAGRERSDGEEREEDLEFLQDIPYESLKKKLRLIERKLYSLNDNIGRSGIEASFEHALRGLRGLRKYETNSKGEVLQKLIDSKEPIPGKRVSLTISLELQKLCEQLLLQSEADRALWLRSEMKRVELGAMNPFIRGGSIVALDAKNGEVLALASIPRFDGNDFSLATAGPAPESPSRRILSEPSRRNRAKWLQNDAWIAGLWDGRYLLEREVWNDQKKEAEVEKLPLSWKLFLSLAIPQTSALLQLLSPEKSVQELALVQKKYFFLKDRLQLAPRDVAALILTPDSEIVSSDKELSEVRSYLATYFSSINSPNEVLACIDMSRLLIRSEESDSPLPSMTIEQFHAISQLVLSWEGILYHALYGAYEDGPFQLWRQECETSFFKEKRSQEKKEKRAHKPYLSYLDEQCREQFNAWWKRYHLTSTHIFFESLIKAPSCNEKMPVWAQNTLKEMRSSFRGHLKSSLKMGGFFSKSFSFAKFLSSLPPALQKSLLSSVTPFEKLRSYELQARYGPIRRFGRPKHVSHLVFSLFSMTSPAVQSLGYMLGSPPGSIFKLVTASSLLRFEEAKSPGKRVNPGFFTFHDRCFSTGQKTYVGTKSDGTPVAQLYKGGRIPKSLISSIGEVDIIRALEYSSNPYFALAAAEHLPTPALLREEAENIGFGQRTGIQLPGEAKGFLPSDLLSNKTAVYTTAIGQHTLLATPLQSALMIASYSSDGKLFVPKVVSKIAGTIPKETRDMQAQYDNMARAIGIHFPIWLRARSEATKQRIWVMPQEVRRTVDVSESHKDILLQAMRRVVGRVAKDTHSLKVLLRHRPHLYHAFHRQKDHMMAKTSTAESYEVLGLPYGQKPFMYSHTGVGTLFCKEPVPERGSFVGVYPDIVVVVSLPYGSYGKEAGPIAACVADSWRRICQVRDGLYNTE